MDGTILFDSASKYEAELREQNILTEDEINNAVMEFLSESIY